MVFGQALSESECVGEAITRSALIELNGLI